MSAVWNFYKVCETDITYAICSVCRHRIPRGGNKLKNFNTTNLIRHLKTHHPAEHGEFVKLTAESEKKKAERAAPKLQPKLTREIGCQTEPVSTKQASKATQAPTPNRSVSCDTGTFVAVPEPLAIQRCEMSTDDSSYQLDVTDSAMNCTSFQPLADLLHASSSPGSPGSSSSTVEPTTSTCHIAAKKIKWEKKILRCRRCRQPYPPKDPEGLLLWVQCDGCHKLFHTICVSSEMDLDNDEFWCFWCLDV